MMRLFTAKSLPLFIALSLAGASTALADREKRCEADPQNHKFCDDAEPVAATSDVKVDFSKMPSGCDKSAFESGFAQGLGGQRHYGYTQLMAEAQASNGNAGDKFSAQDPQRRACKTYEDSTEARSSMSQPGESLMSRLACCQAGYLKGAVQLAERLKNGQLVGANDPKDQKCQMDYQKGLFDGAQYCGTLESKNEGKTTCPAARTDGMFYLGCYHIGFWGRLSNCNCDTAKSIRSHILQKEPAFSTVFSKNVQDTTGLDGGAGAAGSAILGK